MPQWSVDAFFCNFRVQVGDDGGTILLFLLDGCFFPCAPEVLFGMTILFARHLGLHAESNWTCQRYTFMLVMMFCNGILSKIGWTTSWRCPVWFVLLGFSYYHPLFPPKKKSDAEKADIVRAELEQFVAEHGQMPSQHADLISSRSLYAKLKKLKLLHLLKHDWRWGVCDDTLKFFDLHGRIPRRQNMTTDEQRAEDALAQRWDRLLAQKASLPDELLNEYQRIFAAADVEGDDGHMAVCIAVHDFFLAAQRLPRRFHSQTDANRAEDVLAMRWHRLVACPSAVSSELRGQFAEIFTANGEAWNAAVESGLATFSRMRSKGSRFTLGVEGVFARRCVCGRNRSQPFARTPYGRAYGKFCRGGPFWRFQTSGCFVLRGRRGTS